MSEQQQPRTKRPQGFQVIYYENGDDTGYSGGTAPLTMTFSIEENGTFYATLSDADGHTEDYTGWEEIRIRRPREPFGL